MRTEADHVQRRNALTPADLEAIKAIMAQERSEWCETIGYDISSPASRMEIRKDHELIRDLRRAKGKILGAFFTGFGSSVVLWVFTAIKALSELQKSGVGHP